MINKINNWKLDNGTLYYKDTPILGVSAQDIVIAANHEKVKTKPNTKDLKKLLGTAWDCAVVIRERLAFPSSPYRAEVAAVSAAFHDSLGDELFEKFLRPSNRVGLPPAK